MGGKSSRMGVDKSQLHVGLRYNSAEGRITQTDKEKDTSAEDRITQTDKKKDTSTEGRITQTDKEQDTSAEDRITQTEKEQDTSAEDRITQTEKEQDTSAEDRITQTEKEQDTSAEGRITQTDKEQTFAELAHSKLKPYVDEVHYSINKNQKNLGLENTILDEYEGEGPLSGIISALRATEKSILVLGVDMPLITTQSIETLIKQRNWDLLTTTYYNNHTNKWEPMLSIWEYETLPCLQEFFDNGGRSIQGFLNQYGNQRVLISSEQEFTNVNTAEDLQNLK
jgi:molybdopterin-guanine dinucleotide biosynthesis protein A